MRQDAASFPDHSAEFPGYAVGALWKGRQRFLCKLCAYDSLDERAIRAHLLQVHQLQLCGQAKTKVVDVPLYSPSGQLIETREVLDGEN